MNPGILDAEQARARIATLANWRTSPFNHWAFHHVRELVPSADISNDRRKVKELVSQPADLAGLRIDPGAGEPLRFETFLDETGTDGIAILHRGRLVFERYRNGMTAQTPHILMSVSKSMLGLLAGSLDVLRPQRQVTDVIPELEATAYKGATLRDLLDMRAGIGFNEDYLATSGPIVEYRKATGWNPLGPGEEPSDLHSFYRKLIHADAHGGNVHYCSPNTDLLGWVIERATGRRYAELMSELVWKRVGAEYSAYITVDRLGAPRAAGGLCVTLRDLAWYVLEGESPLLFGYGIHGQFLFVDRRNQVVVAKLSSQALPMDTARIGLMMRAVAELRKFLTHA